LRFDLCAANFCCCISIMSKVKTAFVCQNCNATSPQWQGKCFQCGSWNSLVEEIIAGPKSSSGPILTPLSPLTLNQIENKSNQRISCNLLEFDRVLGGGPSGAGFVPGEVVLLGGEPGIGKSTLILQVGAAFPFCIYVTAEESLLQIKTRANRLGIKSSKMVFLAENNVDSIIATVKQEVGARGKEQGNLIIIDSIQTVKTDDLLSVPGTVGQVQECARRLIALARELSVAIVLIGQVTKEGSLAGPKTLEHLVDAVFYLEGDRFLDFRILRGVKNRFGSVNEIGLFSMQENGLVQIPNPAEELLKDRVTPASGSVLSVIIEGQRPLTVEVQALTTATSFGFPRRTVNGFDYNRLLMLLAVLQKRVNFNFANFDVYLSLSHGFKTNDPALDLAACLVLVSALKNIPLDLKMVALGEVDLLGNIKKVSQNEKRIIEAKRLGFEKIFAFENCQTLKEAMEKAGLV